MGTADRFLTALGDRDGHLRVVTKSATTWSAFPVFTPDGKRLLLGQRDFGATYWLLEPK
jgi:hypothetical protein